MFKGFTKSLLGFALVAAPVVGFLLGTTSFVYAAKDVHEVNKEKAKLIEKYTISAEFEEIKDDVSTLSSIDITEPEKAEEIVMQYGDKEIKEEITKLNQAIEQFKEDGLNGLIIAASGVVLSLPLSIAGMKYMTFCDDQLDFTEDAEYYLSKPVIE